MKTSSLLRRPDYSKALHIVFLLIDLGFGSLSFAKSDWLGAASD